MFKKIIIGTAQFGQRYGISKNSKTNFVEQKKIINFARKKKIKLIDTSPYYGSVKHYLKRHRLQNYNTIVKYKCNEILKKIKKKNNKELFFKKIIQNDFPKVSYLLLYGFQELNLKEKKKIYKLIFNLKKKKYIKKFGFTIYSFNKINFICENFKPDVIQCPFNLIDRRLIEKKYINYFKKKNIEVHVRSIFLQGLLLMEKKKVLKKFKSFTKIFEKWDSWLKYNNIKPIEACWNYVARYKHINNYVIGFHELKQIEEIYNIKLKYIKFPNIASYNQKLINPGKW